MAWRNGFIVSVFLVFILVLSGIVFGQRVIDMDKLWGDMRVLGKYTNAYFGSAVAYGDINDDGFMDIIIGAYEADPGDPARTEAGETYVIFGSSNPTTTIDLDQVSADITISGDDADDWSGWAVASGDVNADGYDDIIIGAPEADPGGRFKAGETYVIFGSGTPPTTIDLSTTPADITVCGAGGYDYSGRAVASGDVNGDGFEDIIIGAYEADPGGRTNAGETYVIFGSSFSSPPYTIDLSTAPADITICGYANGEQSGRAVASGDVNSDEYDDIIIGAPAPPPHATSIGLTYVLLGSSFSSPPYTIDLSTTLADITVFGADAEDYFGIAVASGDINGDGFDEIIVGAYEADPGDPPRSAAGETYVIFGFNPPTSVIIYLSECSASITVCGDDADDYSGSAVASGDVNADGYDDLIIGAPYADTGGGTDAGKTYVVLGSSSPPKTIDLSTQSADIYICGDDEDDFLGYGSASGDVNGDGYDDMIIGACSADPGGRDRAGETNLIAGGGAFITAHGLGGKSWIKEFSLLANSLNTFKAFGAVNSQGEVHLALGDMDADSLDEIAAGQGEGGKSWVKFFEVDGSIISTFKAFGAANTNGELHLTIGNFDADTADNEIAIAQGEGGQSWVKVFEIDGTFIRSIKVFGAANAQGEVHLASGDLNKDGVDEIIAGMGEGGSSWVKIFNRFGSLIRSFKAFEAADNPGGEVRLAVGNFDADPAVEIAVSTGYNGGNKVRLFDKDGTLIGEFTAFGFGGNTMGDVQITTSDIDNDGIDEIICGHGEGGVSQVKVFKADGTAILNFKAFGGVNAQGEVHLGKSNY